MFALSRAKFGKNWTRGDGDGHASFWNSLTLYLGVVIT